MRIGIMGGTFDPVHNGHLWIAEHAKEEYALSEVWFMPAGDPYFKAKREVTRADVRFRMTELALEGKQGFCCSDFEIKRAGSTYTAETMRLLRRLYPDDTFYFIIGADSLYQLENWYHPEVLFQNAVILCAGRALSNEADDTDAEIARLNEKYRAFDCDIRRIHCAEMDISSTKIRKIVKTGGELSGLLPEAVACYIKKNGLYLA